MNVNNKKKTMDSQLVGVGLRNARWMSRLSGFASGRKGGSEVNRPSIFSNDEEG